MKPSYEDLLNQLKSARSAVRVWETTMMQVCGEDGPASVAAEIKALRDLRDTALVTLRSENEELKRKVEALAVECHSAKTLLRKIHGESYDSDHEFGKSVYEKDTNFELQDFIENQSETGTSTPATDAALAEVRAQVWVEAKFYAKSMIESDACEFVDFLFDSKVQQLRKETGL